MTARERYAQVRGVRLHYLQWGEPVTGGTVVLLHANGMAAGLWVPVARRLARQWPVLALDFRGHGRSERPAGPYAFGEFAADVTAWLDDLGIGPVHGLGHSLGAVSFCLAAAERPDLFRALVLVEPPVKARAWYADASLSAEDWELVRRTLRRRRVWPDRTAAREHLSLRQPYARWEPEVLERFLADALEDLPDGSVGLRFPPEYEAHLYRTMTAIPVWEVAARVTCPVLLTCGAGGDALPPAVAGELAATFPAGRLARLPEGTTHMAPMELPVAVAELAAQFFATGGAG
ncbi:MAG: alpha/beta hydrolase, partial [Clostridia bacterium]|nr:alpha/beta hydrolase [Clostridia bacterium]